MPRRPARPSSSGTPPPGPPYAPASWDYSPAAQVQRQLAAERAQGEAVSAHAARQRRRRRWQAASGTLIVLVVVGFFARITWLTADGLSPVFAAPVEVRPNDPRLSATGDPDPPPPKNPRTTPLGRPLVVPPNPDHTWLMTNPDGSPVTWDPCRPIHIVINRHREPDGYAPIVHEAVREISRITGLRFIFDGETTEAPALFRSRVDRDRYGNRWSPLMITWTDHKAVPQLRGSPIGVASPVTEHGNEGGPRSFVIGTVALDGPELARLGDSRGRHQVRAVIMHELAHILGLDHTGSRAELMYPEIQPDSNEFGPGDLAGLARLGAGPCLPDR